MASTVGRTAGAFSISAVLVLAGAGCGDDNDGGDGASVPTSISSALESAAGEAKDAFSSATASAASKFDEIKDGLDAKGDASIGKAEPDGDRTKAEVTVENKTDKSADYTLSVDFRDGGGKLVDVVVVNVDGVGAGKQGKVTARSHRSLGGTVTAELGRVVRH